MGWRRILAVTTAIVVPATIVATPVASVALLADLWANNLVDIAKVPPIHVPWAWWLYAWHFGGDARLWQPLAATGGGALAVIGGLFGYAARRRKKHRRLQAHVPGEAPPPPQRAHSLAHGDADWMTMEQARLCFPGDDPRWGSIPVGEAYRPDQDRTTTRPFDEDDPETWGQGGKAPLLSTPLTKGAISGLIIGGSGSYKTMGFTISALYGWLGSIVVMDPSGQVGPMVQALREDRGQTVALIDYKRPHLGSFNVLACIDMKGEAPEVQIDEFVGWCFAGQESDKPSKDDFWVISAKELCACLLSDLLADPTQERSLAEWRRRITLPEPELKKHLASIYGNSRSAVARQIAGTYLKTPEKTFGSIYKVATAETKWLSIPGFAQLLSGSTFDPHQITQGNLTVVIQAGGAMATNPAVGRVIIGTFAGILRRAEGRTETPVPFILDEMAQLGYMRVLAELRDQGRKSGVALFPMWQSIGQIERAWGKDGVRDWYASAAWRMYLAVNDPATAEEVSREGGTYTILAHTEGTSRSRQGGFGSSAPTYGDNNNLTEQRRELISPYEVTNRVRADEALIKVRGYPLLRCGRPLWWRREDMRRVIQQDSYRRERQPA
ncbi:MAG: Conjugal transfer protein traG [Spirosoma sp.]|nr:Conjugal transfer protein traG [Spirosoma sp.]